MTKVLAKATQIRPTRRNSRFPVTNLFVWALLFLSSSVTFATCFTGITKYRGITPNTPEIIEEQVIQNRPGNNARFIGFHGTGADTAQSIIQNGYDPTLVVNQTQQLGPGLYVTDNFGVAVDYAVGEQGREPGIFAVYLPNYEDVELYLMEYNQEGDTVINKTSFNGPASEGQLLMQEYDAFYAPLHHELSVYRSGLPIDEATARTRIASQWKVNARAFAQGRNVAPIMVPLDLSNIENVESLGWQYRGP